MLAGLLLGKHKVEIVILNVICRGTGECLDHRGLWLRKRGAVNVVKSDFLGHLCGQSMRERRNLLVNIH